MELIKVKRKKEGDIYLANCFPQSIKNETLEYFIPGQGRKKTKSFEIVGNLLPERWDKNMNWFEVAKLWDSYGSEVATEFADCLTAGIVARQTARGYYGVYSKIKNILPENFDVGFFEMLRCDYMMACFGMYSLDLVGLDKKLAEKDSDYNNDSCLYKGEPCSMREYINKRYGEPYVKIIEVLNENVML